MRNVLNTAQRSAGIHFQRRLVPASGTVALAVILAFVSAKASCAEPVDARPKQTYLLVCPDQADAFKLPPKDLHWKELHKLLDEKSRKLIQVVDRAEIERGPENLALANPEDVPGILRLLAG